MRRIVRADPRSRNKDRETWIAHGQLASAVGNSQLAILNRFPPQMLPSAPPLPKSELHDHRDRLALPREAWEAPGGPDRSQGLSATLGRMNVQSLDYPHAVAYHGSVPPRGEGSLKASSSDGWGGFAVNAGCLPGKCCQEQAVPGNGRIGEYLR